MCGRSSRCSASTSSGADPCWTRRSTRCAPPSAPTSSPNTTASSTTSRGSVSGRAPGLPQGDPRDRLPEQIGRIRRLREEAGIEGPFTVGAITEPLYVGEPGWDVGRRTLTGTPEAIAESLRAYRAMGVDQIQVRFRNRGRGELVDQMEAFGAEAGPLL